MRDTNDAEFRYFLNELLSFINPETSASTLANDPDYKKVCIAYLDEKRISLDSKEAHLAFFDSKSPISSRNYILSLFQNSFDEKLQQFEKEKEFLANIFTEDPTLSIDENLKNAYERKYAMMESILTIEELSVINTLRFSFLHFDSFQEMQKIVSEFEEKVAKIHIEVAEERKKDTETQINFQEGIASGKIVPLPNLSKPVGPIISEEALTKPTYQDEFTALLDSFYNQTQTIYDLSDYDKKTILGKISLSLQINRQKASVHNQIVRLLDEKEQELKLSLGRKNFSSYVQIMQDTKLSNTERQTQSNKLLNGKDRDTKVSALQYNAIFSIHNDYSDYRNLGTTDIYTLGRIRLEQEKYQEHMQTLPPEQSLTLAPQRGVAGFITKLKDRFLNKSKPENLTENTLADIDPVISTPHSRTQSRRRNLGLTSDPVMLGHSPTSRTHTNLDPSKDLEDDL